MNINVPKLILQKTEREKKRWTDKSVAWTNKSVVSLKISAIKETETLQHSELLFIALDDLLLAYFQRM
jgi:hypothetical protein